MRYLVKNIDYMSKTVRVDGYKRTLADLIGQLGIEFCITIKRMFGGEEEMDLNEAQIIFILGLHNEQHGHTIDKNTWSGGTPPNPITVNPELWWNTVKPRLIKWGLVKEVE